MNVLHNLTYLFPSIAVYLPSSLDLIVSGNWKQARSYFRDSVEGLGADLLSVTITGLLTIVVLAFGSPSTFQLKDAALVNTL